jgi:hypothetical protein
LRGGQELMGERGGQFSEADVPSYYLLGTLVGQHGQEASEDPNFNKIHGLAVPKDVLPTDQQRREIQDASMKRCLKDPHYCAVVDGFTSFVVGKGFSVSADDENEEVQSFVNEFMLVNKFDGRDRQIVGKVMRAGEVFVRLSFSNAGKTAKIPLMRCLNYWEITQINYEGGDVETPKSYVRTYAGDDGKVQTEEIPASEIVHFKFADYDQPRGLPPFGVILAWCQYYGDWLFNRIVLNRMKTSYYLDVTVDGSPSAVTATSGQDTVQNRKSKTGKDILRMPKPGTKLVHNSSVKYSWLKPEVGADDAKEDGRAIRLAICAGAVAPEFLLGDASNANFASTIVSQNPFVRRVEFHQDFFAPLFQEVFRRAIAHAVANKFLSPKSTETVAVEKAGDVGFVRRMLARARAAMASGPKTIQEREVGDVSTSTDAGTGDQITTRVINTKTSVTIKWPALIAQDVLKDTQALQIQKSMGAISTQTARERLGLDDDEEQRRIDAEEHSQAAEGNDGLGADELGGAKRDEQIEGLGLDGQPLPVPATTPGGYGKGAGAA